MVSTSSLFMRLPCCLGGYPLSPACQSLCKTSLFRGVHGLAPYGLAFASLAVALDPGQPFAADHAHDVREVLRTVPAPFRDRDEAEPFGMAECRLYRPTAYPCSRGDLVNGSIAPVPFPVLVRDNPQHRHFGGGERRGEVRRQRAGIG